MSETAQSKALKAAGSDDRLKFDHLAPVYRWLEWLTFGPYLQRARGAYIDSAGGARRGLVMGDGDGRFTAMLLARNRSVRVDAVDVSEAMLKSLQRRAGADAGRLTTQRVDLRHWNPEPGARYDLVVTHFFLDCLTDEEALALAGRVRASTDGGALWIISEFAVPAGVYGRLIARPVIALLYLAFGLLTGLRVRRLPDYRAALRATGWMPFRQKLWLGGLLTSEMWRAADRESSRGE